MLYIAEKPVLGKAIADALPGIGEEKNGVIRKGEHVITWCFGHLLALKEPQDYSDKYKKWNLGDLPIYFMGWENKVVPGKEERVAQIGKLLKEADIVVNCGDTDEEGQLLIDELLRWHNYQGKVLRLDTANTTKEALQKAFLNMQDNKEFENDGWSAYAREVSDMLFGINLTRYYTTVNQCYPPLTVGRVQTPTLGLVVNRDRMIESHKKISYYELSGVLKVDGIEVPVKYIPDKDNPELADGKFLQKDYLLRIGKECTGRTFTQVSIIKEDITEPAPLPFNLTALNNYCGKKWNYTPDRVMEITQRLRDEFKAITYNRSDCQYLSMDHYREAPHTVDAVCKNMSLNLQQFDLSIVSRCFNDENITAHFAIIPTTEKVDLQRLNEDQRNVYEVICNYYLAQFLKPAAKQKTILTAEMPDGGILRASWTQLMDAGYLNLLKDENTENKECRGAQDAAFSLKAGSYQGIFQKPAVTEKETKPPARYTQTSLYSDMTKISKYVDDQEIKKLLLEKDKGKKGENGSIGTSATRAEIIGKLIKAGYLEEVKHGKNMELYSTDKGREFYDMLPDEIKKADVTARWWAIQEEVRIGKANPADLIETVLDSVKNVISSGTAKKMGSVSSVNPKEAICQCPLCGGDVLEGKKGYYCSNYKNCDLNGLWKNACWVSISKTDVKKLLAGKDIIKKAKSKNGKMYNKTLYYDIGTRKIMEREKTTGA